MDPPSTPPPTIARHAVTLDAKGRIPATFVNSGEVGPQISLYLPTGSVAGPANAKLTITAKPLAPTGQPADGTVMGNVYSLAIGPNAEVRAGHVQVQLRIPRPIAKTGRYLIEANEAGIWTDLTTVVVGSDILQARLATIGPVAVVRTA